MVTLVLVRHGQSIWNEQNRFTGWIDISLSHRGLREARKAARKLEQYHFDIAFTSSLIRAQETLFTILNLNKKCHSYVHIHERSKEWYDYYKKSLSDQKLIRVFENDALNERFYGDLQGLNKDEARKKFGEEKVHKWRRSYNIKPPHGESLEDTSKRTLPYFKKEIEKALREGENILIAAHGNSLRAIIMYIEKLKGSEIINVELETAVPIVYELEQKTLQIKDKKILKE